MNSITDINMITMNHNTSDILPSPMSLLISVKGNCFRLLVSATTLSSKPDPVRFMSVELGIKQHQNE